MTLKSLLEQLKARRVRRTMAIYMSSALSTIGITRLLIEVYGLPQLIFPVVVSVLTAGIGSALVFGWHHGLEGPQKFTRKELSLHSLFLIIAVVLSVRLIGSPKAGVVTGDMKSIAVLPFKNLSDSKEDEYFSDGITEDILTHLSRISALQVISRTSTTKYKGTQKGLREIGQELNVGSILEGSVRRAGNRVRISGSLIDAGHDKQLWAETYDRDIQDIFAVQSEVAQKIAGALNARLSSVELEQITKKPTDQPDAYAFYLRGRDLYYRYDRDDNERAIELFKKALAIDSSYALAYAGLGDAYERRYYYDLPPAWIDSAVAVSRLAIAIDPDLPEGYKALGSALQAKGDARGALELYKRAVSLNANYAAAINNIGFVAWSLGSYDEAARWMRKASVLEPDFARWSANVGLNYLHLGLDSLTEAWLRKAIDLQPEYPVPYVWLAYHHAYRGQVDSARAYVELALSIDPDNVLGLVAGGDVELLAGSFATARQYYEKSVSIAGATGESGYKLAFVRHKLGDRSDAEALARANLDTYSAGFDRYPEGSQVPYYVACLYAWRSDPAAANRWLRHAVALGYRDYRWISIDPQLEGIRSTAGYQETIGSLRTVFDQMRKRALQQTLEDGH